MTKWSRVAAWTLVGLMITNIASAACYFILQKELRQTREPPPAVMGSVFPVFSGVDVQGQKWESHDAPCHVLRITDDSCSFCKKDKPSYDAFLDAARQASCEIIELAPRAGGMTYYPRPGVVQLKFVDADVGAALFPFATPHTVILDRKWTLQSSRRGIFDEKSLASSVALL